MRALPIARVLKLTRPPRTERLAAERTGQVLKILEGLLPFLVMPFRVRYAFPPLLLLFTIIQYAAGEIPPDFFYPPLGVGPQGMYLPQSLRTVHGNYPVFPRSKCVSLTLLFSQTTPSSLPLPFLTLRPFFDHPPLVL